MQSKQPDVAIVGAGVIGLSIAWRAALSGLQVVVFDRGMPGGGTSSVAAGMLAPVFEADPAEPELLALMRASAALYPSFVTELTAATGRDPGYREHGTLAVARDGDEAEALEREHALRRSLGLPVARLRPSSARELEPALAPTIRAALQIAGDFDIDPRRLTAALHEAARAAGAGFTTAEVTAVEADAAGAPVLRLGGGERIPAGAVVIAAGPWSGSIAGVPEHARVPLRPVKGQTVRLRDPAGPGLLTRVIRMYAGYLVPRDDGRYVLGGTVEERGFDTTATAGAVHELLRDAIELVPGITELEIEEIAVGLRPGTPDNAPVIGRSGVPGLYWATGHYRHGVLLAPITAELIVAGLRGEEDERATPFSPERFVRAAAIAGAAR